MTNDEFTILFYINGRENSLKDSLKNNSINKMINLDNSTKIIRNRFKLKIKSYNLNLYLFYLCRIEALNRTKKDHTWNYNIGETGKSLLALLDKDEQKKSEIILNMKKELN